MATLASVADIEDRVGRQINDEMDLTRVEALLSDASAGVCTYTGRLFGAGTVTRRLRPRGGVIHLRGSAVTGITSVTNLNGDAIGYSFDGIDHISVGAALNSFELNGTRWGESAVDVTYTYDSGPVPDIIRAVTAQIVARAFGVKADASGISQESISGYSYTIGSAAASGALGMLPAELAMLAPFRLVGGTAWVSMT